MPIAALPTDTSRAITSALVLNDAVSVVKELIDNALDARANAISIEISVNTLDIIQIKDNGIGIGVEDRQLLCKRGCTSKIRTIEDLASLGGTFLGFRGEALASVAELSASVTISTRIEGEVVGSALKYCGDSKLSSSSSVSHPVGTTVRIQDFLSRIPVRKQAALKTTTKTFASLRKLLQGYAFARPDTRLSLKVLKSKDSKANWSYVPSHLASPLSEVASKIVGRDVSAQCKEYVNQSEEGGDENEKSWILDALLLEPNPNLSETSGTEQHFSVDNRPVNADKGVIRDMSKLYKQYLRSACERMDGTSCPSKPFLNVRITCPPESYDVNVEPAKDELLFYQPFAVKGLFEKLLIQAYGNLEQVTQATSSSGGKRDRTKLDKAGFDLLMAPKPASEPFPTKLDQSNHEISTPLSQEASRGPLEEPYVSLNMYPGNDDDISETIRSPETINEERATNRDMFANNPWTIAKMNVVLSPKRIPPTSPQQQARRDKVALPSEVEVILSPDSSFVPPGDPHRTPLGQHVQLRSSITSSRELSAPYQNPGPPSQVMRRRDPRIDEGDDEPVTSPSAISTARGPSLLDTWIEQTQNASQRVSTESRSRAELLQPTWQPLFDISNPARQGQISPPSSINIRVKQPDRGLQQQQQQQQRSGQPIKTSFKPPFKNELHFRNSLPRSEAGDEAVSSVDRLSSDSAADHISKPGLSPSTLSNQRDLDEILEFEWQKRMAVARQRKQAAQMAQYRPYNLPSPCKSSQSSPGLSSVNSRPAAVHRQDSAFQGLFDHGLGVGDVACTPVSQPDSRGNNPYQNRYLAAIRNLEPQKSTSGATGQNSALFSSEDDERSSEISQSDPRGYLIHHNRAQEKESQGDSSDVKRTGLKIRRTKTIRLPLEAILAAEATHHLAKILTAPDTESLATQASALVKIDEYQGSGEVRSLSWDQDRTVVNTWQACLRGLIKRRFQQTDSTTYGDDEGREDASFGIHLGEAIKSHVVTCGK